ncbi:concanavalin A-like lectin/glucanase superfamily protein [Dysgonomonas alginatilytica]|uniref:Concanavalin A-like lectin/glucanase superfamily protein n=1 Tax=Dysgonomonas alginatilytica TaxID=1605892 RepID=A0A2V3PIC8_9BACT|nr:LamG domain-containing protein [Dysgonomonas alginatilytica]PXV59365.1 concanavalin A-like lectin/glucanase superfamily protein [Dysgonomonas alginatilytica]
MKQNKLYKIGVWAISLLLIFPLLIGCSSDDKEVFVLGDPTELKAELAAALTLWETAAPTDFEQVSLDEFKETLTTIQGVLSQGGLSSQEIINMTIHLREAQNRFLRSKLLGIPAEALIAGWAFDEGEGSSLVSDGMKKLTANLTAGPSKIFPTLTMPEFVDGVKGKAIHFKNGSHLEIPNYAPADFLGQQLSIAVWLKPDVTKGGNYVASLNYWNNWKFQIQEQGKAFFTVQTTQGFTDADNEYDQSVAPGRWAHVVVSLDLSSQKLSFYVNGRLTKEWTSTTKPNLGGAHMPPFASPLNKQLPLMIGTATTYDEAVASWTWSGWDTPTSWDHFEGAMDEIKFYNIALIEGQVKALYNEEIAPVQ